MSGATSCSVWCLQLYPHYASVLQDLSSRTEVVAAEMINRRIGFSQTAPELATLLTKMQLDATVTEDGKHVSVDVGPTRPDVIHQADIWEDCVSRDLQTGRSVLHLMCCRSCNPHAGRWGCGSCARHGNEWLAPVFGGADMRPAQPRPTGISGHRVRIQQHYASRAGLCSIWQTAAREQAVRSAASCCCTGRIQ